MSALWYQSDLMDEVCPEGFSTIEQHLARDEAGNLMLADFYGEHTRPAVDGQVVRFERHENLGTADLAIADDWTWTLSTPAPEGFTDVTGDNGWLEPEQALTVNGLIAMWRDEGDISPEDTEDMEVTFWRLTYETFRVDLAAGALVPLDSRSGPQ